MKKTESDTSTNIVHSSLEADCKNCFGLCCVALYFSTLDGFPHDKTAGQPCQNLNSDFSCRIHKDLPALGMRGCMAYDCLGAGQKVAQVVFGGKDWMKDPETSKLMFDVFLIVHQLHELLWYLTEALTFQNAYELHGKINSMIERIEQYSCMSPEIIMELDMQKLWADANVLLMEAGRLERGPSNAVLKLPFKYRKLQGERPDLFGKDLRRTKLAGADLHGSCLIAANLSGLDLSRTDFIGADLRDADLSGADLSRSIFLTQAQINSAKGNADTKLPVLLQRPIKWGL